VRPREEKARLRLTNKEKLFLKLQPRQEGPLSFQDYVRSPSQQNKKEVGKKSERKKLLLLADDMTLYKNIQKNPEIN